MLPAELKLFSFKHSSANEMKRVRYAVRFFMLAVRRISEATKFATWDYR